MSTEDTRPKTSLTERMASLRDRVARRASELEIPTARSLIIQRRWLPADSNEMAIAYLEIDPKPIIDRVSPTLAAAFNTSQQIKIDDLLVSGISRRYPKEHIIGTGISYFVDSQLLFDRIAGGFEAEFVIINELPLTWNLILRRRPDERRGL
ncbi:hypothetical protein WA1_18885 [Scytonema hofmannii PCC 7110]|uniref:Uncharacterized protein n=1 Tax=Scytonema hofmannii PCC 7110 TaxID=128403 RepID=A0A139XBK4_9CYAN|nr:hypothetical protein [Scytonema hofmannii]KYC42069.1 hypothetical protein WA1_18885 [Scytonema hofmannii PCC 7110]